MKRVKSTETLCNCSNCEHAIFCPSWGNYKCVKNSFRIDTSSTFGCDRFEKAKTDPQDKTCHCKTCMERGDLE